MIEEAYIRLTGTLDFDILKKRGWAHPKNPSNAYQDTLVKEIEGLEVYAVQRGEGCQVAVLSSDIEEACRVLSVLQKELE